MKKKQAERREELEAELQRQRLQNEMHIRELEVQAQMAALKAANPHYAQQEREHEQQLARINAQKELWMKRFDVVQAMGQKWGRGPTMEQLLAIMSEPTGLEEPAHHSSSSSGSGSTPRHQDLPAEPLVVN